MNFAEAKVCQCIIIIEILNKQPFPHQMVLSSMPVSIWYYTYATIPRRPSIMDTGSAQLSSDIPDLVQLETEKVKKVLSLSLSLSLLLLQIFSSPKLGPSLPPLSLTSLSSNAEAHIAKLIPCWHSRTELHWQNNMMDWCTAKHIDVHLLFCAVCFYFGRSCQREKLPVCEEGLYQGRNN